MYIYIKKANVHIYYKYWKKCIEKCMVTYLNLIQFDWGKIG